MSNKKIAYDLKVMQATRKPEGYMAFQWDGTEAGAAAVAEKLTELAPQQAKVTHHLDESNNTLTLVGMTTPYHLFPGDWMLVSLMDAAVRVEHAVSAWLMQENYILEEM